ncbi:MAG: polysaccharide biosynthesis C-terminal domain-containing protein [Pseudomonadota bacterium]
MKKGPEGLSPALKKLRDFTISSLAASALQFLLSLAKSVIFTRMLGPSGRGVFSLLLTIPALVVSFGNLGFGLGSVYLAARKKVDISYLLGNALAYLAVHGLILVGVGSLLFVLAEHGLIAMEGAGDIKTFILASIPLVLLYNLGLDLLTGLGAIYVMNVLGVTFSFLPIVLFLLIYFLGGEALTAAMCAWMTSTGVIGVIAFFKVYRKSGQGPRLSWAYLKAALSFGLRGNPSMFANAVVRRIDVLFLAHYHGVEAVGFYAAAVSLAEIILTLPNAVSTPFLPLRLEMNDRDGRQFSPLVVKYVLFIMFFVCLAAALTAKPVLYILYGRAFHPSLQPLLLLLPGILALTVYQFLKTDVLSLGRPGTVSLASVGTMVVNLLLNILLIPKYGPSGAAVSSSVSYAASTGLLLWFVARKTDAAVADILFMKRSDLSFFWKKIKQIGRKK